jgi:FtsH-binding integral membrane protein
MEYALPRPVEREAQAMSFVHRVFAWMAVGLTITGAIAWVLGTSLSEDYWQEHTGLLIGLIVLELAVVFGLVFAINRISATLAVAAFFLYSALNGVTLSIIFLAYTTGSIAGTFFICAGMFASMATLGWITKRDLSGLGSILFMALIGLILASVVNLFVASSGLYWVTTFAGVLIFAGLTAYDMNKIKQLQQAGADAYSEQGRKAAVLGALSLYLDFINLFLFLLRIFGARR